MKVHLIIVGILAVIMLSFSFFSQAAAMDDPGFIISRMVISEKIAAKEPIGIADTFSAATEKVSCFLEAKEIEHDTTISFVWYFENKEIARVSLPLTKGKRWRTHSSKKLAGRQGNWKVELRESSGVVLNSISFRVQ